MERGSILGMIALSVSDFTFCFFTLMSTFYQVKRLLLSTMKQVDNTCNRMAAIGKDGHDITHCTQRYRGMQLYMHSHRK